MKPNRINWLWAVGLTAAVGLPATHGQTLPGAYTLGRFMPADVWMYVHGVHNNERAFLEKEWADVSNAFMQSGVLEEFKNLLMEEMSEEERGQAEGALSTALELIERVDWRGLLAKEVAFGYRLNELKMGANGPPTDFFDYIVLMRGAPESMDKNTEGLVAILNTLAGLSENVSLTQLVADKPRWVLAIHGAPFTVQLIRHGDVIALVMGNRGAEQVSSLLAGAADGKSIVANERFRAALAKARTPEDSVAFFDVSGLMGTIGGYMALGERSAKESGQPEQIMWLATARKLLDMFDVLDYAIITEETEGKRTMTYEVAVVRPDKVDSPMMKLVSDRQPFKKFDTYIPQEATAFSIGTGIDMERLYQLIIKFVKTDIPGGADGITKMEGWMKEHDFDPHRDIFSWWSGEYVSVSVPPAVVTPMGGADGALLLRVKNSELAREKVNGAMSWVQGTLSEIPQAQMFALTTTPAADVEAEGFKAINAPIFMMAGGLRPVYGFSGEWMMIGSSSAAINKCLKTAKGEAPSVLKNERFMKEGIVPDGPVMSASFTDLSNLSQELTQVMFGLSMAGALMPPDPELQPMRRVFQILTKLGPVVQHLDFFSSSASISTVDGAVWRTRSVITYKPTAGEAAPTAAAASAE